MTENLCERLEALAAVVESVRAKVSAGDGRLDGLTVARVLVAADQAARRLGKLDGALKARGPDGG
jgi:hypothetical protein